MILVDTSVWVSHFRKGNAHLAYLLNEAKVLCHSFIIGELACGNIQKRTEILSLLNALPASLSVEHDEVMQFITNNRLMGKGLGYIDVTLLASAKLTNVPLWTFDNKLNQAAILINLNYKP